MARKEWIGEYWLNIEKYHPAKQQFIYEQLSLGKCLGNEEAKDKAVQAILREYPNDSVRDLYITDGWGNVICS